MAFQVLDYEFKDLSEKSFVVQLNVAANVYAALVEKFRKLTGNIIHLSLSGAIISVPRDPRLRPLCITGTFIHIMREMIVGAEKKRDENLSIHYQELICIAARNLMNGKKGEIMKMKIIDLGHFHPTSENEKALRKTYPDRIIIHVP